MAAPKISSQNDFVIAVRLYEVASGAITKSALTTGTVTGFLATTNSSTATAAEATLIITASHVSNGWWRVSIDGSVLTQSLMNTHFLTATPYLILVQTNNIRRYVELDYDDALEAPVEA